MIVVYPDKQRDMAMKSRQIPHHLIADLKPVTEPAKQLAMLACIAEIQDLTAQIPSGQNILPQHHTSMMVAATLIPLKKYGFEQHPEYINQSTATFTESAALLALKLAIAETRDEIPRHHQESNTNVGLRRLFAYISRSTTSSEQKKTQAFLQARLKSYEIELENSAFLQTLNLTYHSHRALQKLQAAPEATEFHHRQ